MKRRPASWTARSEPFDLACIAGAPSCWLSSKCSVKCLSALTRATEEFVGERGMTCEEFAMAGLEIGPSTEDGPMRLAAREHLRNCPHCAALYENWQGLRDDLHALGVASREPETPHRVEVRLRQQFRVKHATMRTRRTAAIAAWALAAAIRKPGTLLAATRSRPQGKPRRRIPLRPRPYLPPRWSSAMLSSPPTPETLLCCPASFPLLWRMPRSSMCKCSGARSRPSASP